MIHSVLYLYRVAMTVEEMESMMDSHEEDIYPIAW